MTTAFTSTALDGSVSDASSTHGSHEEREEKRKAREVALAAAQREELNKVLQVAAACKAADKAYETRMADVLEATLEKGRPG